MALQRNDSLDALRGLAILAMVLSGSIAFGGVLPAWMYHAQVPPPLHQFNPGIRGISWVDLVFPFFLFSMGAAIPLALQRWTNGTDHDLRVVWVALRRFGLLAFFALFVQHFKSPGLADAPAWQNAVLTLTGFALLTLLFYRADDSPRRLARLLPWLGWLLALGLLAWLPLNQGQGFDRGRSDIILLVLADMALFGTLAWWFTRHQPLYRLALLPMVMAIFLAGQEPDSWTATVYHFTPWPWLYKFYYLKYLFIVLPGTFVGEWLLHHAQLEQQAPRRGLCWLGLLAGTLVLSNVVLLFGRHLTLNLWLTLLQLALMWRLLARAGLRQHPLTSRLLQAGGYLLLLGLCFEAYEGGIRKDGSTYSYYFVCSGLACLMLIALQQWQASGRLQAGLRFLARHGRNPMVAYVAGSLVLLPLLQLTGLSSAWGSLNGNAWQGLLKGMLFTAAVSALTLLYTRRGWFWRT